MWRYCLALTGRPDHADDLAQSTCARALEKADLFDPGTHLDRWLFRMAQRLWLNGIRSEGARPMSAQVDPDETVSPQPETETNIFAREVFSKIEALPVTQRIAVLLVYVEGYTYAEAAAAQDVPIGTIMSRLATARRKLTEETGGVQ